MKLKPLSPTLREKKRYIAFETIAERTPSASACRRAISDAATELFGDVGVAAMGLQVLTNRYTDGKGVLRVAHTYVDHVRAALAFVDQVDTSSCTMRSLATSGLLARAVSHTKGEM